MTRASMSQPATILVVDDSEVVLNVTRTLLEAVGYRVLTHSGPAGCVAVILQEKPDLVLIDVNMPKLGGETIVKLFGKAQPNSETIILLFSTLPAEQLEPRARAAGAHGYIRKTEDTFELVRQVNRWLRTKDPMAPLRTPSTEMNAVGRAPANAQRPRGTKSVPPPGADRRLERLSRPAPRTSGTTHVLPTVLFIDEDMEALSSFRRDVQGEPYRADFALSAAQALRHLDSGTPPDLIVASLEPSGIDIYDRALALGADWKKRFVFATRPSQSERAGAFLETFRGLVLSYPVDAGTLRGALRHLLSGSLRSDQRSHGG
jgi:CheY-like chemotaxis protein